MNTDHSFDVAIIGGSIAGSYAANLLTKHKLKVALLEQHMQPRRKACGEGLSIIAVEHLARQGLWSPELTQQPIMGYQIQSSKLASPIEFHTPRPIAFGVNRDQIIWHLLKQAQASNFLQFINARVRSLTQLASGHFLVAAGDRQLTARQIYFAAGSQQLNKLTDDTVTYYTHPTHRFALACWASGKWRKQVSDKLFLKSSSDQQLLLTPISTNCVNLNLLIQQNSRSTALYNTQELIKSAGDFAEACGFIVEHIAAWRGANAIEYKEVVRAPENFYVLGDAACRLDPISGLGMTHAIISTELAVVNLLRSINLKHSAQRKSIRAYNHSRRKAARRLRLLAAINYLLAVKQPAWLIMLASQTSAWLGYLAWFSKRAFAKYSLQATLYPTTAKATLAPTKMLWALLAIALWLPSNLAATPDQSPASIATWFTPAHLSTKNLTIEFAVDSTWHMVHGKVTNISGLVQLKDPGQPGSIEAQIEVPVIGLDTDNSMRDDKLRTVMDADTFQIVKFKGDGLDANCTPALVMQSGSCSANLAGLLTIRDVSRPIKIPLKITRQDNGFLVTGHTSIDWSDYGVADPSIFIAKVDKIVNITFNLTLNSN